MRNFLPLGAALFVATALHGQSPKMPVSKTAPLVIGEVLTFHSGALGEERELNVYLPVGYSADSSTTYPVIYVLDGSADEDFLHIAGLVQFMNMYDLLPKSIVVGIANVDRYRDFTQPTTSKSDLRKLPQAGGSQAFIRFLSEEVQPLIQQEYRIKGPRMIIGQSLGGLLAVELLLTVPDLFEQYVIVSPSLWWNDEALVNSAATVLKELSPARRQVFLALGTEGKEMQQGMDKLVAAFKNNPSHDLQWWCVPFPEESHATILHRAAYRAFELLGGGK